MLLPMRFVAEPISDLRLKRFHRWAMLWLKWFVAFLDAAGALAPLSSEAQCIGHLWLDGVERIVLSIVMLRAAPRVRPCNKRRGVSERRLNEFALRRAIIGSALRRSLRPKDLRQRIEALTQSTDALVARLLRRLPRGLTRRRPIKARREAHDVVVCDEHAVGAPLSDTS
jgi:hypothetical protein